MDQDADEVVKIEHELEILRSRYALMERWARVLRMVQRPFPRGANVPASRARRLARMLHRSICVGVTSGPASAP